MEFLAALVARLSLPILNWIYDKVGNLISKALETNRAYDQIKSRNKKVREQTESAVTEDERKDALKNDAGSW